MTASPAAGAGRRWNAPTEARAGLSCANFFSAFERMRILFVMTGTPVIPQRPCRFRKFLFLSSYHIFAGFDIIEFVRMEDEGAAPCRI
jgi:hypothetical protein